MKINSKPLSFWLSNYFGSQ